MPRIGISKEQLEGLSNPPAGTYVFRIDGFKPKLAKAKVGKDQSINLRPTLVIINHPTLNDKPIFAQCNTAFGVDLFDMCHALGVPYDDEDSNPQMPGEFQCSAHGANCDDSDPENWNYIGPLMGQTGQVEIGDSSYNNKPTTAVKKFFCRVTGCTKSHRDSLL